MHCGRPHLAKPSCCRLEVPEKRQRPDRGGQRSRRRSTRTAATHDEVPAKLAAAYAIADSAAAWAAIPVDPKAIAWLHPRDRAALARMPHSAQHPTARAAGPRWQMPGRRVADTPRSETANRRGPATAVRREVVVAGEDTWATASPTPTAARQLGRAADRRRQGAPGLADPAGASSRS